MKTFCLNKKEIVTYLIVGVLTTVLALAVYYGCVFTFLDPNDKFQLQVANVLSWTSGVIFAYFTNRKYVFESKNENRLKEAMKFTSSRLITLFMDMAIMWIFVTKLGFNDKIMKLISTAITTIANYVFSKIFVFKE